MAVEVSLLQCSSGRKLRFKDRVWGRAGVDCRGRNQMGLLGGEATSKTHLTPTHPWAHPACAHPQLSLCTILKADLFQLPSQGPGLVWEEADQGCGSSSNLGSHTNTRELNMCTSYDVCTHMHARPECKHTHSCSCTLAVEIQLGYSGSPKHLCLPCDLDHVPHVQSIFGTVEIHKFWV